MTTQQLARLLLEEHGRRGGDQLRAARGARYRHLEAARGEEADEEGEELSDLEPLGYLTMDTIAKGLELAQQDYSEEFSQHIPNYNNGDGDSADVLFQLMVMGDVAYG